MRTAVGETFQSSPAVIAFLYDHGIDVWRTPSWEIEYLWDAQYVVVESTDPWRVRFTIPPTTRPSRSPSTATFGSWM